jgi:hypothetical protein
MNATSLTAAPYVLEEGLSKVLKMYSKNSIEVLLRILNS